MKNSQTVIRSILGTADVDIRPLAYAVDAAVELMFRQGIPEDDIAVTKELYAKAAERLPKGKKGKRSVKTVTKQIQRVANACWILWSGKGWWSTTSAGRAKPSLRPER